jgi:glycogen debranching enzyme
VTSALGHLLGTGLLDAEGERSVARYLSSPDLDCGLGLRTLSAGAVGFNPLGYHTGSVWPHDTVIAAAGLRRAGYDSEAWSLVEGLLQAATAFEFRLPELFAGHGRGAGAPAPYPAACRPQAWAAATAVAVLQTVLGLDIDAPAGWLRATPLTGPTWPISVDGLRVGGHPLAVHVDAGGAAHIETTASLRVAQVL